jgi:outer membrane protein assembly factor BamB
MVRQRPVWAAALAASFLLAACTGMALAQPSSLPPVTVKDLGIPMVQRLDLGGVMVMEPPQRLAGLSHTPPTLGPTSYPGAPPPVEPGPGHPILGPGGGTAGPQSGVSSPLGGSSGTGLTGGVPVVYTVLSGPQGQLVAVDPATGEQIGQPVPLPGITGAWSLVQGLDGRIYIGGYETGDLYVYDPATGQATNLGNPTGDSYIFSLSVDPVTGLIWGGTWPSGALFSYDPETATFHNYGQVEPGETYVRAVAAYDGRVYAGLGDKAPELVEFDPATGTKTQLPVPVPPSYQASVEGGTVGVVQVVAPNRLFAEFLGGDLYSIPDGRLVSTFGEPFSLGVSLEQRGPVFFYTQHDTQAGTPNYGEGWVQAYNMANNTEFLYTSPSTSFAPYLWGDQPHELWLVNLHTPTFPGYSLVALDARAHLWVYNPETGNFVFYQLNLPGQPELIETLGPGPAGSDTLYGAGYLQGDSFTYSASTGETVEHQGPGQAEGMAPVGPDEFFGTYPGGVVWKYDPSQPFVFGPSPLLQKNPVPWATLGNNQIRPFALLPMPNGQLLVGSVPTYADLEGALSTVNAATPGLAGQVFPLPAPLAEQSPITLAPLPNGQVLGGTTVSGGNPGGPPLPTSTDPYIFRYDPATDQVVPGSAQGAPFVGQWAVDKLVYDPSTGMVYGLSPTFLFVYDPSAQEVVKTLTITQTTPPPASPSQQPAYYDWGQSSGLVLANNGLLYALLPRAGGSVLEVDPSTLSYQVVAQGMTRLGVDAAGNVYAARGAELYALLPQG